MKAHYASCVRRVLRLQECQEIIGIHNIMVRILLYLGKDYGLGESMQHISMCTWWIWIDRLASVLSEPTASRPRTPRTPWIHFWDRRDVGRVTPWSGNLLGGDTRKDAGTGSRRPNDRERLSEGPQTAHTFGDAGSFDSFRCCLLDMFVFFSPGYIPATLSGSADKNSFCCISCFNLPFVSANRLTSLPLHVFGYLRVTSDIFTYPNNYFRRPRCLVLCRSLCAV